MAETEGEGVEPLHVNLEKEKGERGKSVEYGTVLDLYNNQYTGEHVEMCWVDAGKTLLSDEKSETEGEELFIVEGSLMLGNEEYLKWGWIRFPAGNGPTNNQRSQLKAGSNGAQVFRKTGHLSEEALKKEKIQISEDW